jgi:predicted P-loop ATPase
MNDNIKRYIGHVRDNGLPLEFDENHGKSCWRNQLICSPSTGNVKPLLANAITALRLSPQWRDVLAFNEFSLHVVIKKKAPWQSLGDRTGTNWGDYDDSRTCEWLQNEGIFVTSAVAAEAVQTVAKEHSYHPVKDYLLSLKWDTQPRIQHWLPRYLGAPTNLFIQAIGPRWLRSAVARIFKPGCQADHVLLLEGAQGIRNSTLLRSLTGDIWFSDHISDLGTKDYRLDLLGKWIVEFSELDAMRRVDIERVKAFLSCRVDHFRPPYGRRAEDVPRSCVFAATVNDETPLLDETGNRRFWPVPCREVMIEELDRDRDQIWAEAVCQYQEGKPWWLESNELNEAAKQEQESRYDAGVWDEEILEWIENPTQAYKSNGDAKIPVSEFRSTRDRVTITDILVHCIGKPLDRCFQSDKNQVVRCLVHAGWKRTQERSGPDRGIRFYTRPSGTRLEHVREPDVSH